MFKRRYHTGPSSQTFSKSKAYGKLSFLKIRKIIYRSINSAEHVQVDKCIYYQSLMQPCAITYPCSICKRLQTTKCCNYKVQLKNRTAYSSEDYIYTHIPNEQAEMILGLFCLVNHSFGAFVI